MTIFYIVIAVLVLLFGILSYLNFQTWHIVTVLATFSAFFAAFAFMVLSALVLKTQAAWRADYQSKTETHARLEAEVKALETGVAINEQTGRIVSNDEPFASVLTANAELKRVLHNRGRVWRGCQAGQLAQNSIDVVMPARQPDPTNPMAPAPSQDRSLAVDTVVYAFGEVPRPNGIVLPGVYLGEFIVTTTNFPTVSLEPALPLTPQQAALVSKGGSWTLYDQMPTDNREIYAEMEQPEVDRIIDDTFNWGGGDPAVAAMLKDQFARTGKTADPNDPPATVWKRVTFLKDLSVDVDSDSDVTGPRENFESATGLAVAPELKQGAATEFKQGDTTLLDATTAAELSADGTVKIEEDVYLRPLHDFSSEFRFAYSMLNSVRDQIAAYQGEITLTDAQITRTQEVTQRREALGMSLDNDLNNVTNELEQITAFNDKMEAHLKTVLAEVSRTYRSVQTLREKLVETQEKLKSEIDSRLTADEQQTTL
ncbi:DUF5082 domain-containing protein [Blastopirellula sp. JC732]|uniref:DUF5082 domain-containing protein n=1 Tax=Blastopirellula sediminis TaxID=2894196 RepID=A0A9X1MQ45_9BACT|nr:DUF5082 domain-containing protein [Blastopirellula sediminis]MCC9606387.1 DUF5082 domain-containing protein [Blastopirellula sediminis]MCC9630315.1 DUF5082 domain-containing protein [Blastopirellula sediminis]